ncbi:MAG: hypothetical protein BWY59_00553 [Verrucomicrobia bacterium ADurb.Bin345]|nr:MAG: hypothetical protein BWY59_00553 [Verrucomicrobia bacterium ADurb.Bin345]
MNLEIYAYKCRKCGQLHYPYRMMCKKCHNNEHNAFDPVPLPHKGKLLTFTRLQTLAADFSVPDIQLGIVELENGIRMLGQLQIAKPKSGMAVTGSVGVVRQMGYNTYHGMIFHEAK